MEKRRPNEIQLQKLNFGSFHYSTPPQEQRINNTKANTNTSFHFFSYIFSVTKQEKEDQIITRLGNKNVTIFFSLHLIRNQTDKRTSKQAHFQNISCFISSEKEKKAETLGVQEIEDETSFALFSMRPITTLDLSPPSSSIVAHGEVSEMHASSSSFIEVAL